MNNKIAILYSTVDGQTLKISKVIKENLEKNNCEVHLFSIVDFDQDILSFDTLVIGASIRYGVHNEKVIQFIKNNKSKLDTIKTSFFSVNLVARKPEKSSPETNPYVIKFFNTIDWKPTVVTVFAGNLDYQKYPFFDRIMIQFIMWITKGPTDSKTKIEYTNWQKVKDFSNVVCKL